MKNTNKLIAAIVAIALLTWTTSIYAMWNWHWQWRWKSQNYESKEQTLTSYTWTLSETEKQELSYGYSEEMLAHDLYTYFYSLYNKETFNKIASSETQHMQSVKSLLDKYGLQTPTAYGVLQSTFDTLKAEWEKSLQNALEVWLKVEMLDIDDISKTIAGTTNPNLQKVFLNIWWASYNHLKWFANALASNNLTTNLDYSKYLSQSDLSTKWSLKYKLSDKLKADWVNLVSYSWSSNDKKIDKEKLQKLSDNIDKKISNLENSSMLDKVKEKTINIYNSIKSYIQNLLK